MADKVILAFGTIKTTFNGLFSFIKSKKWQKYWLITQVTFTPTLGW